MIGKFIKEQKVKFNVFTPGAKKLIWSNLLFGLFNPFYLIFSSTFIFNSTNGNIELNLLYSFFTFIGIISGFILNGYLIRRYHVKNQMILGMALLFITIVALFFMPANLLTGFWIFVFGLVTGICNGIYWSSRNFLTLTNTHEKNRDFFTGLDNVLISTGRIVTPLIIGLYLGESIRFGWFSAQTAYRISLIFAFLIILFSSIIILKVKFTNAQISRNFYLFHNKLWQQTRLIVVCISFFQGAFLAVPAIFIMKYIGNEAVVGTLSSISYAIAILVIYFVSSHSKTEHRTTIIKGGAILLLSGALFFSLFINVNSLVAMAVLTVVMFISDPVINFPFRATFMKVIDELKHIEKFNDYSYIVDVEIFTAVGRVLSIGIFYFIFSAFAPGLALSIYIVLVALVQFLAVPLSKKINGN